MKPIPTLITRPDGTIVGASAAAEALIGPGVGLPCHEVVRAEDPQGHRICNRTCADHVAEGLARDAGAAKVHGNDVRLICTPVGDQNVITMLPTPPVGKMPERLSPQEREVLALVARGLTTARVARRLGISPATVRTHVEHVRGKLGSRSRAQAVARALALGEIE